MPGLRLAHRNVMLQLIVALSIAFGPQIIDLSLRIEDGARQSLQNAPDADVPATLVFRDEGIEKSYAVTLHVKGQLGSARAVDDWRTTFSTPRAARHRISPQRSATCSARRIRAAVRRRANCSLGRG